MKGVFWLSWVCFLDLQLPRDRDSSTHITQEMESQKKQWFVVYGMRTDIYDFLRSMINRSFAKENPKFPGIFLIVNSR